MIISEATRSILGVGKTWKPKALAGEGETAGRVQSVSEGSAIYRSPVKSLKVNYNSRSPHPLILSLFTKIARNLMTKLGLGLIDNIF